MPDFGSGIDQDLSGAEPIPGKKPSTASRILCKKDHSRESESLVRGR